MDTDHFLSDLGFSAHFLSRFSSSSGYQTFRQGVEYVLADLKRNLSQLAFYVGCHYIFTILRPLTLIFTTLFCVFHTRVWLGTFEAHEIWLVFRQIEKGRHSYAEKGMR